MANEEHFAILKQGIEAWNQWRANNPTIKPDLSGISLYDCKPLQKIPQFVDFTGANFSETNLSKINFKPLAARGGYYTRAYLAKVNFTKANLSEAVIIHGDLNEAVFIDADLMEANLEQATLKGADLSKALLGKTNLLQACLEKAILTGACIEDWQINSQTNLDGIICDFVYLKAGFLLSYIPPAYFDPGYIYRRYSYKERHPSSGNFVSGEFSKLFQEIDNTVNLIFRHGINWKAFAIAFNQVNLKILDTDEQGEIFLREYKFLGNGLIALKVTAPPGVDKANLRDELMSAYQKIVSLEGEPKVTNELLALLYERLLLPSSQINLYNSTLIVQNNQQVTGDVKLMSETNSKTNKEYTFNGNVGSVENQGHIGSSGNQNNIGNAVGEAQAEMKSIQHIHNYAPEQKQTLAEAAEEIQQLLDQLQTEGYNLETAQQQVASDLASKAQSNPTFMNQLVKCFQYLGDAAAKRLIGEETLTVFKLLAQSLGITIL